MIGRCGSRPITAYGRGGKLGGLKVLIAAATAAPGAVTVAFAPREGDGRASTHNRYATGEMLAPTGTQTTLALTAWPRNLS